MVLRLFPYFLHFSYRSIIESRDTRVLAQATDLSSSVPGIQFSRTGLFLGSSRKCVTRNFGLADRITKAGIGNKEIDHVRKKFSKVWLGMFRVCARSFHSSRVVVARKATEADLQTTFYAKELSRVRKAYALQMKEDQANTKQAVKTEREAIQRLREERLAAKKELSLKKQEAARVVEEAMRAQKEIDKQYREQRRLAMESQLSAKRRRFVSFLTESTKDAITLENLDARLALPPVPWKYEYIPFCSPEAPYWKENVNPLYVQGEVGIHRIQQLFERAKFDVQSTDEKDLGRLMDAGLFLHLQDNAQFARDRQQYVDKLMEASTGRGSTIVDDSDYLLRDPLAGYEDFPEGMFDDFEGLGDGQS